MVGDKMNGENSNNTEYNTNIDIDSKDIQDLDILMTQSKAQLILMLGYYLEYIASQQAIELINLKYAKRQMDAAQGIVEDEDDEEEDEYRWQNEGINADKTALLAAQLELYGQTIITRLDYIKLQRFAEDTGNRDYTLSTTANREIYIGAMLEELAYIFNLQGVQILYSISNQNPILDD